MNLSWGAFKAIRGRRLDKLGVENEWEGQEWRWESHGDNAVPVQGRNELGGADGIAGAELPGKHPCGESHSTWMGDQGFRKREGAWRVEG